MPLLEIQDLTVRFDTSEGSVHAVNGVTYSLEEGETLGVVGESGSGKSVHVLSLLGLIPRPPGRIAAGRALFRGRDLLAMSEAELRQVRGAEIGIIFQDPMTALNPVLRVSTQIVEALVCHRRMSRSAARRRAVELLDLVGIPEPQKRVTQYPHEFSGGMRQRVMIAIGIACEPKLLIADEPTTALDVTVQAQVLDLMRDLKKKLGMAMIWITHDMGVVAGIADTVQVMYGGRILERGPTRAVFRDTRSAYTWGLLRSLPDHDRPPVPDQPGGRPRLQQIGGQPPDLYHPPPGDPFAPRNPWATERCRQEVPPLAQAPGGVPGHLVAAWYDLRDARGRAA
ncbi:ABC transporter ATP-binding protein [Pseudoroseomonas cervicalis]|uniref:ABC transporter ATP-binding protein n=1 Tax=Teichococcus cervicalis TaxID=204525 RepID=UPI0027812522|nr:ABC transporter ATP-binding protein [Pseudoroseomonas cervicalis]MDQ1077763.1 oligopeptide transport system ATP-binding protein [Pseudoroseomonas cervicalis]